MAIEEGLLSLLFNAPATALNEVLRRYFALGQEAALLGSLRGFIATAASHVKR